MRSSKGSRQLIRSCQSHELHLKDKSKLTLRLNIEFHCFSILLLFWGFPRSDDTVSSIPSTGRPCPHPTFNCWLNAGVRAIYFSNANAIASYVKLCLGLVLGWCYNLSTAFRPTVAVHTNLPNRHKGQGGGTHVEGCPGSRNRSQSQIFFRVCKFWKLLK